MSLIHCDLCDRPVDTDEDVEGVHDEVSGIFSCSRCQEKSEALVMRSVEPKPVIRLALASLAALALSGCMLAPTAFYSEYEHVSHPLAGPPFGPENEEDWLDQLVIGAEWDKGGAYVQVGLGYVVTDGGFYGPPLTGTVRAGYRFNLRSSTP